MKISKNKYLTKIFLILFVFNTFSILTFTQNTSAYFPVIVDQTIIDPGEYITITWRNDYEDLYVPGGVCRYQSEIYRAKITDYENQWVYDWEYIETIFNKGLCSYSEQLNTPGEYVYKVDIASIQGLYSWGIYHVLIDSSLSYRISVMENIDIKIVYDGKAYEYIYNTIEKSDEDLADSIRYALRVGFKQYFYFMEFHVGYDDNWLIYDENGYDGDVESYGQHYFTWRKDENIGWDILSNRELPSMEGHGDYFDLLILCTYDENIPNIGGATDRGDNNYFYINLAANEFNEWSHNDNDYRERGFYSTVMHETGHVYGITSEGNPQDGNDREGKLDSTGDTEIRNTDRDDYHPLIGGYRKSVMDGWWGYYGYGDKFDIGHCNTILLHTGMWPQ
ncbi:MAG: hypothetical protein KGD63_07160 [Candidatus Lokiarchaeota archaeon]|nr:hypothetical protein [Candidatus Lokiarchaeota archaeon]